MPTRVTAADRKRLVEENTGYVRSIAAKIKSELPPTIEFDDLVAYGMQGLLEASERYDPRHGSSFTTFAYYRIRGAVFDGLRGMGWLPRGEYARARMEERSARYLDHSVARDEGAQRTDEDGATLEDEVRDIAETLGGVAAIFLTSLDAARDIAAQDTGAVEGDLERAEVARIVRDAITRLPDKERELLQLYYYEDKPLEEAGEKLGLSKSWASRLHARAVSLLRAALEDLRSAEDPDAPAVRQRARRT